jgi:hypothetical protein
MELTVPDSIPEGSGLLYWAFIGFGLQPTRVGHPIEVTAPAAP